MNRPSRAYGLLGLARRAGGVVAGTDAVREAIRCGEAKLVVLASDAAAAQRAKVRRTLAGHPVLEGVMGTRAELGAALGIEPVSAVAVTSPAIAVQISVELAESPAAAVEA